MKQSAPCPRIHSITMRQNPADLVRGGSWTPVIITRAVDTSTASPRALRTTTFVVISGKDCTYYGKPVCTHLYIYTPKKLGKKSGTHTYDAEGSPCHVRCSTIACVHSSRLWFSRSGVAHLCTAPNKCDEQSGIVHKHFFHCCFSERLRLQAVPKNIKKYMPR